jgi:hypothetical protein
MARQIAGSIPGRPAEVIEQLARGRGKIVWEEDLSPIERMGQAIALLASAWEGVKRVR